MLPLLLIVFLDLVGFGMIIPLLPFYAERLGIPPSLVPFLFGLYSLGQLVGAPVWGAMSDRWGRRPILLATLAANVAANLLLAVAGNGWLLGASRLFSGLAAGNISTAYAYVADVTDEATRPQALGRLGAAFGLGFIFGPAIGGLLAGGGDDGSDISRVAYAAAVMSALALVATWAMLKESHGHETRAAVLQRRPGLQLALLTRPVLRDLLLATLIVIGAVSMLQGTFSIWAAQTLGVGPRTIGVLFGFIGTISVAVQGGGISWLTRRYGPRSLTMVGAVMCAVSLAVTPFAATVNQVLAPMAVYSVGTALFVPSISSLVTATAGATERGSVLGLFQGAASLGRVVGPFLASVVAGVVGLRGPFLVGAVVSLVGVAVVRHGERLADQAGSGGPRE